MGDHCLKADWSQPISLHQVISRDLISRLPLLAPVRSVSIGSLGALHAPAGFVTVAFMCVWPTLLLTGAACASRCAPPHPKTVHGGVCARCRGAGTWWARRG